VCEGHLGHIFEGEGFNTPTDQRYCINGKVLKFVPKAAADDRRKGEKDPAKDNKPSKKSE
jgi:peptide-methionine (R)-S-oxide reductase